MSRQVVVSAPTAPVETSGCAGESDGGKGGGGGGGEDGGCAMVVECCACWVQSVENEVFEPVGSPFFPIFLSLRQKKKSLRQEKKSLRQKKKSLRQKKKSLRHVATEKKATNYLTTLSIF
jgi:hypothetical protein